MLELFRLKSSQKIVKTGDSFRGSIEDLRDEMNDLVDVGLGHEGGENSGSESDEDVTNVDDNFEGLDLAAKGHSDSTGTAATAGTAAGKAAAGPGRSRAGFDASVLNYAFPKPTSGKTGSGELDVGGQAQSQISRARTPDSDGDGAVSGDRKPSMQTSFWGVKRMGSDDGSGGELGGECRTSRPSSILGTKGSIGASPHPSTNTGKGSVVAEVKKVGSPLALLCSTIVRKTSVNARDGLHTTTTFLELSPKVVQKRKHNLTEKSANMLTARIILTVLSLAPLVAFFGNVMLCGTTRSRSPCACPAPNLRVVNLLQALAS